MKLGTAFALWLFAMIGTYIIYLPVFIVYAIKSKEKKRYFFRQAYALDVLVASLLDMEYPTISETIGYANHEGRGNWFTKLLCKFIGLFDKDHCVKVL